MSSTTSTNPSSPVHNTSLTIEQTFTFPHTIDRVWFVIRDVTLLNLLKPDVHFPLIPKDGKNVWNIHAEFLGKNDSHEEYTGKCVKVKNFPQYKKIVWDINTTTNKFLRLKYQLFQVGDEGETVLLYKLKFKKKILKETCRVSLVAWGLRTRHSVHEDAGSTPGLAQWVKDPTLPEASS